MSSLHRVPINPSLLIGLGGSGQDALLAIRERIMRSYGSLPPMVKLLSLDTDDLKDVARPVLRDDEFRKMEVKRVREQVEANADEYDPWMDIDRIPFQSMKNMTKGAGQIRQLGRFSLLYNLGAVLPAVRSALSGINDWAVGDDERFYSDQTSARQIVFFGSISGGTGAGTLLDLASAIGSMPEATDYQRNAYLIMPGAYRGLPNCFEVEENGYAFLKELDFMLSQGHQIRSGSFGPSFEMKAGSITYTLAQPFDNVLLIDNTSMGDVTFSQPSELSEAVAVGVFTTIGGPIGAAVQSGLVNPSNQGLPWDGGMLCEYSSFGVTELYYPKDEIVSFGLAVFAERLVGQMRLGQAVQEGEIDDINVDIETFLRDNAMRERGAESSEIVAAILTAKPFAPHLPKEQPKDSQVDEVWQKNQHLLAEYEEALAGTAASNRAAQVERIRTVVSGKVDVLLRERGGVYARAFVEKLTGYFEAVNDELRQETATAAADLGRMQSQVDSLGAECREKAKKLVGRREAVERVLSSYRELLVRRAATLVASKRAAEGQGLCQSVLAELGTLGSQLAQQETAVSSLLEKAREATEMARVQLSSPSPFQIPVQPDVDGLSLPDPSARHFYEWLKGEKGLDALAFWSATAKEAHEHLLAYAQAQDVHKPLSEATLTSILAAKTDAERQDYLKRVGQRCQPLFSDDPGVSRPREERLLPTSMYIVGAPVEFFDLFKNTPDDRGEKRDLRARLSPGDPGFMESELDDPERAYFFRRYGALPAYALGSFQTLRNEYLEVANAESSYSRHLDKRWGEILPDLDPRAADASERLWIWALASSDIHYLKMVSKRETHYSFDLRETLADGTTQHIAMSLGQGEAQARKTFLARREWVAQAESRIVEAITLAGNAQVLADLGELNERRKEQKAKASKDRASEEQLADIQAEIDAIAAYRAKLQR